MSEQDKAKAARVLVRQFAIALTRLVDHYDYELLMAIQDVLEGALDKNEVHPVKVPVYEMVHAYVGEHFRDASPYDEDDTWHDGHPSNYGDS